MSRVTHEGKVLALLSDGKPHSHHALYALHVIAHSRVSSLRAKGYGIEAWRDGDDYMYQLVSRPLAEPGRTDAGSGIAPRLGNCVPAAESQGHDRPGSASGCVSGVLPDNDRVDTNVQSPAPLDPSALPGGQLTLRWAA